MIANALTSRFVNDLGGPLALAQTRNLLPFQWADAYGMTFHHREGCYMAGAGLRTGREALREYCRTGYAMTATDWEAMQWWIAKSDKSSGYFVQYKDNLFRLYRRVVSSADEALLATYAPPEAWNANSLHTLAIIIRAKTVTVWIDGAIGLYARDDQIRRTDWVPMLDVIEDANIITGHAISLDRYAYALHYGDSWDTNSVDEEPYIECDDTFSGKLCLPIPKDDFDLCVDFELDGGTEWFGGLFTGGEDRGYKFSHLAGTGTEFWRITSGGKGSGVMKDSTVTETTKGWLIGFARDTEIVTLTDLDGAALCQYDESADAGFRRGDWSFQAWGTGNSQSLINGIWVVERNARVAGGLTGDLRHPASETLAQQLLSQEV